MDPNSYLGRIRGLVGSRLLLLPTVRAICEDARGYVLLQKRSDFNNWGVPGGMPEPGESAIEAIVREVFEETGLRVSGLRPVGFASQPASEVVTYPNGHQIHSYALILHTTQWTGDLNAGDEETTDLAFFDPRRLPEMEPCQRRSVEMFLAFQASGQFQLD